MSVVKTVALVTLLCLGSGMAEAQYRGMACEQLYYERNLIYKNAGFCFKTERAIRQFGNAGCQYDRQADVPLTRADRAAVADIIAEENYQGCPR